jgi:glycine dehydrogenase
VGRKLERDEDAAVIESVKAAAECKAPVSGTVTEVNTALASEPGKVNSDPMGAGWFFKLKLDDRRTSTAAGRSDLSREAGKMTQHDAFARRHIGPGEEEQRAMLGALGIASMEELIARAVPAAIRREKPLDLPAARSEAQALAALKEIAAQNKVMRSFIGLGYSGCHTPSVILRNVLENPAWYTAYTPYQPEISQGRLEALINFQTMVSDLTGMDIANASMLDEPTAAAEAMTLAARVTKSKSTRFFRRCPVPSADARCRAHAGARSGDRDRDRRCMGRPRESDAFGALLQYPGTLGELRDLRVPIAVAKKNGTIVAVACDLLALTLLAPPGELGADIAVGSAQRFGVPPCYGGPHAGFFATRDAHKRTMPGGSLARASMRMARPGTGLRCRHASSTSGARRRRATSAPHRCCSP